MAIVRNPLSSEAARGKFGPVLVFSAWRALNVVRTRVSPTNPRTSRQLEVRSILAGLSSGWAGLTANQAAAWSDFSAGREKSNAFGKYYVSGFNGYQELNFYVVDNGGAAAASPPVTAFKGNITTLAAVGGGASGEIDLTWAVPAGAAAGDMIDIWITSLQPNELRSAQESDFRHLTYAAGNAVAYTATGLTASGWYYLRARFIMSDGRAGVFQEAHAQATA